MSSFQNLYSNHMNGTDEYADVPDNAAFSFTDGAGNDQPFSVVIWMKRDAAAGLRGLLAKFTSGGNAEWSFDINGATLRFAAYNAAVTAFRGRNAPMATIGSWVGLAGTYDGTEATTGFKLYTITGGIVTQIDNANMTTGAYSGMTNGTSPLYLGAINNGGVTAFLNGLLYHPQIWTGVLNTTDLGTIGANPHQDVRTFGFANAPISAWKYNNGTSDYPVWTDYVNGRNATMQNQEAADIEADIP